MSHRFCAAMKEDRCPTQICKEESYIICSQYFFLYFINTFRTTTVLSFLGYHTSPCQLDSSPRKARRFFLPGDKETSLKGTEIFVLIHIENIGLNGEKKYGNALQIMITDCYTGKGAKLLMCQV